MTALTARDRKGLCPQQQHKQREKFISIHTCLAKKKEVSLGYQRKTKCFEGERSKRREQEKKRKAEQSFPPQGILLKAICSLGDGVQRKF